MSWGSTSHEVVRCRCPRHNDDFGGVAVSAEGVQWCWKKRDTKHLREEGAFQGFSGAFQVFFRCVSGVFQSFLEVFAMF